MKLIVITRENPFPEEADCICELFANGLEILHLRKPFLGRQETARLLSAIPIVYHPQIVLHDHYELTAEFHLKGIHLNMRNAAWQPEPGRHASRSCHTIEEVEKFCNQYNYLFLSPVFDSISKTGYQSGFTGRQLSLAAEKGFINNRVIALGGITPENISMVSRWKFGGVAMIGTVWGADQQGQYVQHILERFKQLKIICDAL